MPATATPTPAEVFDFRLWSASRPRVALEEAKRRIETELPPLIDYVNDSREWEGHARILKPERYEVAPADLTGRKFKHSILIDLDVRYNSPAHGADQMNGGLRVHLVGNELNAKSDVFDAFDWAGLVMLLLRPYRAGCQNPDGIWAWRTLVPRRLDPLPDSLKYYGKTLGFDLDQKPGDDHWLPATP